MTTVPKPEPKVSGAMLADLIDDFVEKHGQPTVAIVILVREGVADFEVAVDSTRAEVYHAVGLLEQAKFELLATIPENKPLREPQPEPFDDLIEAVDETPGTESKPN